MGLVHRVSVLVILLSSGANELALQVVDIALVVEQVLLLVALDLNSAQTFFRQVLRIVHVDYVIIFIRFTLHLLVFVAQLVLCGLLLKSENLALSEVVQVQLTVGESVLVVQELLIILILLLIVIVIEREVVLARRIHQKF